VDGRLGLQIRNSRWYYFTLVRNVCRFLHWRGAM